jgi:hypothetical protein
MKISEGLVVGSGIGLAASLGISFFTFPIIDSAKAFFWTTAITTGSAALTGALTAAFNDDDDLSFAAAVIAGITAYSLTTAWHKMDHGQNDETVSMEASGKDLEQNLAEMLKDRGLVLA